MESTWRSLRADHLGVSADLFLVLMYLDDFGAALPVDDIGMLTFPSLYIPVNFLQ